MTSSIESFAATEPLSWKDKIQVSQTQPEIDVARIPKPLTIDALIRLRSEEGPNEAIVSYPSSGIDYVDYTSQQLDVFAYRVAQQYQRVLPQRSSSSDPESVVGLLGPSNFEYFITILALTKLGHTVLFLSTRISIAAYVSLLQATGAQHILIDSSFRDTAEQVKTTYGALNIHEIASASTFNLPITDIPNTKLDGHLDPVVEAGKIAWIIHSSGSTGLPKPIYQTHSAALNNYASNLDMRGFITLPLYHAHGISSVFRAIHSRKQIYMYNATLPLTEQYLLRTLSGNDFQIFYGVPYALKILSETTEGIEALAKLKVVMFGGSACPDAVGKKLVDNGVNLISHYGTTETGQLMTSFRDFGDKDWDYVRVPANIKKYLQWEMRSPGIYELVVLDGLPSKVATNRPDGSYATKDLFTPHPTTPDAWKYFARLDDTIVLVNGEKFTPTSFEQAVRQNKYITEAVMFGSGKSQVSMIIIPSPATKGLSPDATLNLILPVLVEANESAPGYAKLGIDMIRILPVGTEYPRTDKGTVIRAAFYRLFEKQFEEIYDALEVATGELCLSEAELRKYVRSALMDILGPSNSTVLEDDTDFFSIGVDSLQAIQLRSILGKNIQTNGKPLTSNVVFNFPTVKALARELYCLRTGDTTVTVSTDDKMKELISKYSVFEKHVPVPIIQNLGSHLVVTGATGSLGAHLVSQLVLRSDVSKVYCLVRASSPFNAKVRVIRSLRERDVYHTLPLEARKKIVALPANFGKSDLGLSSDMYSKIASDITGLIHCAWSVNFNLGLGSFEADCIAGAHNLITLCLKAGRPEPATFNFCSSVSAVAATKGGFVPEALPAELTFAQNMGYAQSKLVTENICLKAAEQYGIKARVLRIGQVIGDTVHGIWNATEAIPMMLQAAETIGAIPRLDEEPLWLPVDVVASSVADISLTATGAGVMNVVNHKSFHWTRDLLPALHKSGLQFKELGQKEWVDALRNSNPDPKANPPIKLLEFFASKYDNDLPRKGLKYDTTLAQSLSPSLAAAPILNQDMVDKFIKHWQSSSWITTPLSTSRKTMIVVGGPCGAGKTSIAKAVSEKYSVPCVEGDHLHSESALAKMTNGVALHDEDRWEWLEKIRKTVEEQMRNPKVSAVVVTCSALKRSYRDKLRTPEVKTVFVMLQGTRDVLYERMDARQGHYMRKEMVDSQLATLEAPGIDETDIIPVDISGPMPDVQAEVEAILADVF